jgi:hypothetical protein
MTLARASQCRRGCAVDASQYALGCDRAPRQNQFVADRLDKWYVWLTAVISAEIHSMHLHRRVWLEVRSILERNDALPPSYWWIFMADTYAVTQGVAVRRQVDNRKDVISLARLLIDIRGHPTLLSRDYFLSRFDPNDADKLAWAESFWAEAFAGKIGNYLDPAIPKADLSAIVAAAENVKDFVDAMVAHRGQSAFPTGPELMLSEVHEAIDTLGATYRKYYGLITGYTTPKLVPELPDDWIAVFRHPWIAPPDQP